MRHIAQVPKDKRLDRFWNTEVEELRKATAHAEAVVNEAIQRGPSKPQQQPEPTEPNQASE